MSVKKRKAAPKALPKKSVSKRQGAKPKEEVVKPPFHGLVHRDEPLSETLIPKIKQGSKDQVVEDLRAMAIANPEIAISRNYYRVNGKYSESVWSGYFGTFEEFKRQADLKLTRYQHAHERAIAKHASVDHYRAMNEERRDWGDKYIRDTNGRFKTMLVCSDLHDELVDPFYMRVLVDTARRAQPEIIVLNGDVWDASEFGKYTVDPRSYNVVSKIKFVHEKILAPLREACPNAQIDWISGNHEGRLVKHLADATPAMRSILSDLHGFTVGKLLGLEKYEVNFIAKSDLSAYTASNIKKEVAKDYKVYFDCYVTNHFPEGIYLGMPGTNGHCHKFKVTPCFNETFGSYSWVQTGCGHIKDASYCNGEKWDMGFLMVHIDTHTKSVNQEYVPIRDFAVTGGQFYYRSESEFVKVITS